MKLLFGAALAFGLLTAPAAHAQKAKPKPAPRKTTATQPAPKPSAKAPATPKAPVNRPEPAPAPEPEVPTIQQALGINIAVVERPLVFNLGVGVGNDFRYGSNFNLKATPALTLSVDKSIIEGVGPGVISVGGLVGYQSFRYDYPGTAYRATWNYAVLLARGAYHYNFTQDPRLDTYAGVSLGLGYVRYKDTYLDTTPANDPDRGGAEFAKGIFVGGRYYLTDNLGAFAELGYDMSYLKFGVSARF